MLTTVSIILAAASLAAAVPKLTSHPRMRASAHFGIALQRYQLIGVAELAAMLGVLAGLVYRPLGILAAACLAPLLLGAIAGRALSRRGPGQLTRRGRLASVGSS